MEQHNAYTTADDQTPKLKKKKVTQAGANEPDVPTKNHDFDNRNETRS